MVLLDDIRSLANVGSIFRTADSFNVQEIILGGITGTPPHREIQRTALGATESVKWKHEPDVEEAIRRLKKEGFLIASVEQCESSVSPTQFHEIKKPICLVLGNEVMGVKQSIIDNSDLVFEIPQLGTKHSLNVTVAAGVVIWECFKAFNS